MSEPTATAGQSTPSTASVAAPNGGHPITIDVRVRLQALAIPETGGGYSVIVPALPGCVTAAETIEEAQANVIEAAEGWLGAQHDRSKDESLRVAAE